MDLLAIEAARNVIPLVIAGAGFMRHRTVRLDKFSSNEGAFTAAGACAADHERGFRWRGRALWWSSMPGGRHGGCAFGR